MKLTYLFTKKMQKQLVGLKQVKFGKRAAELAQANWRIARYCMRFASILITTRIFSTLAGLFLYTGDIFENISNVSAASETAAIPFTFF